MGRVVMSIFMTGWFGCQLQTATHGLQQSHRSQAVLKRAEWHGSVDEVYATDHSVRLNAA